MSGDEGLWMRTIGKYRAYDGRAYSVEFDKVSGLLKAKGCRVAKLKQVMGPFPGNPEDEKELESESREMRKLMYMLKGQDSWNEICKFNRTLSPSSKENFWRTLIMDRDDSHFWLNESYDIISPAPKEFGSMAQVAFGEQQPPTDFLPHAPLSNRTSQFSLPFRRAVEMASSNRGFFTTECTQMGIGPYCAQSGDEVAVLFGSPLFVILRQVETSGIYQLVGDAYLHGAMHGELVTGRAEEELEVITLR